MSNQGPLSPGTASTSNLVGTNDWSNIDNIKTSDAAVASNALGTAISYYAKASNFGFSIPTGAVIDGILFEVNKKVETPGDVLNDYHAYVIKADGSLDTDDHKLGANWPDSLAYSSYGGSADLWSLTWAAADINDVDFGFAIAAQGSTFGGSVAYIEHIRATVYYHTIVNTITGVISMTGVQSITFRT